MLEGPIEGLVADHFKQICADRVAESQTLEFKRDPPGKDDKSKDELRKDVCALANADGGDLVFGIGEIEGVADRIVPIENESADDLTRRIRQTLDSRIEPRLLGVRMKEVALDSGYLLAMRVPASLGPPHSYSVSNSARRFVTRSQTTTSDMTYDQLRSAFGQAESLLERSGQFIRDRASKISKRKFPVPFELGPVCVLHFVPLAGLAGRVVPDLPALSRDPVSLRNSKYGQSVGQRFTLDGLIVNEEKSGYRLFFRNGAVEAALAVSRDSEILSGEVTRFCRRQIEWIRDLCQHLELHGPGVISLSMLHVADYSLISEVRYRGRPRNLADRPHIAPPAALIDSIDGIICDEIARPLLDVVWQSFGLERCEDYDPHGAYRGG